MPIFTDPNVGQSYLEEIPAPLSDVLATTARETLIHSPISSGVRILELSSAEHGSIFPWSDTPPPEKIAAETARQQVKDAGVDLKVPDDGIAQGALDILIRRKHEEKARQDILNRAPGGILAGGARVVTGLAAGILDPVNIGLAFVPVVGEARAAALIGRASSFLGRTGIRAGIGAAEGLVGAVIAEPLVYGAARQEQADYDLTDSLLNIGLGTAFGAGLHMGVGAGSEAISRGLHWSQARPSEPLPQILDQLSPDVREQALRTSVAQAVTGRQIDVEAMIRAEALRTSTSLSTERPSAGLEAFLRNSANDTAVPTAEIAAPRTMVASVSGKGGVRVHQTEEAAQAALEAATRRGTPDLEVAKTADGYVLARRTDLDVVRQPDGSPQLFKTERSASKFIDAARDLDPESVKVVPGAKRGTFMLARNASPEDVAAIRAKPDAVQLAPAEDRSAAASLAQTEVERQRAAQTDIEVRRRRLDQAMQDVSAAARNNHRRSALAEPEYAAAADVQLREAPKDDAAFAQQSLDNVLGDVTDLAQALGDDVLVGRELQPYDDLVSTAEAYGRAVRAAASCGLRRGLAA